MDNIKGAWDTLDFLGTKLGLFNDVKNAMVSMQEEIAKKDALIAEHEKEIADLWYTIIVGGGAK